MLRVWTSRIPRECVVAWDCANFVKDGARGAIRDCGVADRVLEYEYEYEFEGPRGPEMAKIHTKVRSDR